MNKINKSKLPKVIFLMGPTSSGKTALAIELCKFLPLEVISVDSALIYKGMDIGTAKPNKEELSIVPHRLLNILDPKQTYSVSNFYNDALTEISKIISTGSIPLLVGGTMFYYKALLSGLATLPAANQEVRLKINQQAVEQGWGSLYRQLTTIDPVSALRIHPNDLQRISRALEVFLISGKTLTELTHIPGKILPYQVYQFGIIPTSRELLYQRIESRFYHMLAAGFETEVQALFDRKDLNIDMPSIRCVGYRQMWLWIEDKISYSEMINKSIYSTKQLAKRQITWLRRWKNIIWLDSEKRLLALNKILKVVNSSIAD